MCRDPEIKLPLGAVVHAAADGEAWVFVGYIRTSQSHLLEFYKGNTTSMAMQRYSYRASNRTTLVRVFPDIVEAELK